MGRRGGGDEETISLFPFMSILACVIGVLTLMIAAVTLSSVGGDPNIAKQEELESLSKQADEDDQKLEELQKELENSQSSNSDIQKKLAEARKKLNELKKEVADELKGANTPEPPKIPDVDEKKHQQRLKEIQEEMKALEEELKKLREELKDKKKPPEEAQVQIRPSGSGVDIDPTFVEVQRSAILIYLDENKPIRVIRAELDKNVEWLKLLDQISKRPKASVIFLMREDAISMYNAARAVAINKGARNGKLPVIGHGKIDLSMFKGL